MLNRRQWCHTLAGLGIGSATFQRALAAQAAQQDKTLTVAGVTAEMIQQSEWISGITLTDAERKRLANEMNGLLRSFQELRKISIPNHVPPALVFQTLNTTQSMAAAPAVYPPWRPSDEVRSARKPSTDEELAFSSIATLSHLLQTKQVSSRELTKLYLDRLKKYNPALLCVVSFTEDLALKQAEQADKELASGNTRSPLHGVPWGAKDLIAYPGYKTTWGAGPYQEQSLDMKATVAQKLEDAGAVLIAKLTLGALAMGDRWFGGMTRNPWDVRQGSSGSSAGSASATVAGLVGFALGSETLGSIVSPCTQCGASGLRPTFGRVSRHGCMALAWSMDKIGPITRSIEDCALVFAAIQGQDPRDPSTVARPFHWNPKADLKKFRVGFIEAGKPVVEREELRVLKEIGVQLTPMKLPTGIPIQSLRLILTAETGAAFDELTRQGIKEGIGTWPRTFQQAEFIPAIEYIRANRIRTLLMQEMDKVFEKVDLYVGGNDLVLANFTGHPSIVMPSGFRKAREVETPTAVTMTGRLYGEADLLAVAHAYQQVTGHHLKHPPMDKVTVEFREAKGNDEKRVEKKPEEKK